MNILNFAGEFTRLVIRYTKASSSKSDSEEEPLTNQQVINVVHSVLATFSNTSESELMKIQINQEQNDDFRFQNIQSDILNTQTPKDEEEAKNSLKTLSDEKKFISRSSPAIYVNSVGRSDTFICEKDKIKNNEDVSDVCLCAEINHDYLQILDEAWRIFTDIRTKIDHLKRKVLSRTKQRLSSTPPDHRRPLTTVKTVIKIHKPISTFSDTSMSSKLPATRKKTASSEILRRKSISGPSCVTEISQTLNRSKTMNDPVPNLSLSTNNKMTDLPMFKSVKNPKYANVQSTIPKPISYKKKIQNIKK